MWVTLIWRRGSRYAGRDAGCGTGVIRQAPAVGGELPLIVKWVSVISRRELLRQAHEKGASERQLELGDADARRAGPYLRDRLLDHKTRSLAVTEHLAD